MNFRTISRALLAGSVHLFLAACASGEYALQMTLSDETEREHVLVGTMAIGAGAGDVRINEIDGGMQCSGVALIGYAVPGCASSGSLRLECADGRTVSGDWEIDECRTGQGTGSDNRGNPVSFLIGDAATVHDRSIPEEAAVAGRLSASHMLFVLGNGYAAGFDLQPDNPDRQRWQVVFASRESGLNIVELTGSESNETSIVLAQSLPQEGSEIFVVTHDGILAGSMTIDSAAIMLDVATSVADGLPVLNGSGEVIGLTRNLENELQLFDSLRLRRYLALLDPQLAGVDTTRVSPAQLRKRMIALPAN